MAAEFAAHDAFDEASSHEDELTTDPLYWVAVNPEAAPTDKARALLLLAVGHASEAFAEPLLEMCANLLRSEKNDDLLGSTIAAAFPAFRAARALATWVNSPAPQPVDALLAEVSALIAEHGWSAPESTRAPRRVAHDVRMVNRARVAALHVSADHRRDVVELIAALAELHPLFSSLRLFQVFVARALNSISTAFAVFPTSYRRTTRRLILTAATAPFASSSP